MTIRIAGQTATIFAVAAEEVVHQAALRCACRNQSRTTIEARGELRSRVMR